MIAAIAGLIVASGLGLVAFIQYHQAKKNEIEALRTSSETIFSSGQEFDALMEALRAETKLQRAAWTIADLQIQDRVTPTLRQAVYGVRERNRLEGHSGAVNSVRFSPDGKTIASANDDGTMILWNLDSNDLLMRSCNWVRDYLKNNPNVSKSDRHLCDGIGTQ